jgi:hypothetical protein
VNSDRGPMNTAAVYVAIVLAALLLVWIVTACSSTPEPLEAVDYVPRCY